jgi:hypothetical protein
MKRDARYRFAAERIIVENGEAADSGDPWQ